MGRRIDHRTNPFSVAPPGLDPFVFLEPRAKALGYSQSKCSLLAYGVLKIAQSFSSGGKRKITSSPEGTEENRG